MTKVRVPEAGEVLGQNYLLEKEIGRGGFGVVFKARHIDIDRIVAIKVLLATYALKDPRAKDRFKREATIAASLDYPNSLRIFDYGETEEGVFYIVMEFVQGNDLGKILQNEGHLAVPRAIHITRQILHSLMEAHARGIVHRDIKPDNVMVVPLAYDTDHVKVMDFGIAKMVDSGEEITQHGITLGTPRYMPIEQLKGDHLGPATDLYATGLVLYEMLVGRPAFTGESAVDTAVAVMEGGSVRVPDDAGVPEAVAAIVAKASARHAEDRYQSARAFLDALNALDPALLDVDKSELERFAPPGTPGAARSAVTSPLRIQPRRSIVDDDVEDSVGTQLLSTRESLSTEAMPLATPSSAPPPPAPPPQLPPPAPAPAPVASEARTVAAAAVVDLSAQATQAIPIEEVLAAAPPQRAAASQARAERRAAPPLLVAIDAATLIVALIILFVVL